MADLVLERGRLAWPLRVGEALPASARTRGRNAQGLLRLAELLNDLVQAGRIRGAKNLVLRLQPLDLGKQRRLLPAQRGNCLGKLLQARHRIS